MHHERMKIRPPILIVAISLQQEYFLEILFISFTFLNFLHIFTLGHQYLFTDKLMTTSTFQLNGQSIQQNKCNL